jgi:type I restriction enzyme, S subunit
VQKNEYHSNIFTEYQEMTVKKTQENLSTALERTEQALGGLENSLGKNVEASLLATAENSEANDGLPEGWADCKLMELGEIVTGNTPSKKNPEYYGGKFPIFKPGDLGSSKGISEASEYLSETGKQVSRFIPAFSTYVTCIGATISKTGYSAVDGTCNQQINAITSNCYVNARWLYFLMVSPSIKNKIITSASNTTLPILNKSRFSDLQAVLPPLAEQTVIAQTLDTLLAQVDNIKTRLDAIPKILKIFRQSVLAAAVSGKLAEEWRGENECGEWKKLRLDDVCDNSFYGPRFSKSDYSENGFPTIRTTDMTGRGEIKITSETPRVEVAPEKIDLFKVRRGDLLITRTGSIGVMAIFKESFIAIPSAYLIRFRFLPMVDVQYIYYYLTSPDGKNQMGLGTTTTTQPNINAKKIREISIEVPPLKEQTEIVRRVKELFAFADQIEQQVKNAQKRVNTLTQSILAKAFRGELTAQWRAENPDLITGDNSAEALLAKIKEERDALKQKAKPKKKTALKKAVNKK